MRYKNDTFAYLLFYMKTLTAMHSNISCFTCDAFSLIVKTGSVAELVNLYLMIVYLALEVLSLSSIH